MERKRAVLLLAVFGLTSSVQTEALYGTRPKPEAQIQPHIILIVADDLGWNDVSWNNPHALTPNLEKLAKDGVLLNQSYVQPICTPTRSALMTGRYPFTLGRQRGVLWPEEPTGLTIKRQLLPQALKAAGYSTHAVGKWHLGFCSWDYTPTSRGFDTFWGYYTGAEDYYHHTRGYWVSCNQSLTVDEIISNELDCNDDTSIKFGYDFRNNTVPEYSVDGDYSTYVFSSYIENMLESRSPNDPMFLYVPFQSVHGPLQVPENYTKPFAHIKHHDRRIKFGMVLAMDEAVGRIVDALKTSGHYDNSVIVFTTDNGGPTVSAGNNWPLRGNKSTLWEGGTRGAAFVHSPLLTQKGTVSNKLIHVTDWFSTLVGLGGGVDPGDTDGYDQWEAISTSAPSPRLEMIYNIDIKEEEVNAGIRMGDYKLLVGYPGPGEWTPPPEGIQSAMLQDTDNQEIIAEPEFSDDPIIPTKPELSEALQIISSHQENSQLPRMEKLVQLEKLHTGPFSIKVENIHDNIRQSDKYEEQVHDQIAPENDQRQMKNDQLTEPITSDEDLFSNIKAAENDLVTVRDLDLDINQYLSLGYILNNDTAIRLYNIIDDPEERKNLALDMVDVVKILIGMLHNHFKDYIPPDILPNDPHANPSHWNNTWTPGWCHAK